MLKKGFFAPLYSGVQNDREGKNVIARRNRSNLIFTLVEKFLLIITFTFLLLSFSFAQVTYNLEVIFKRTNWSPDSILSYGYSLSTVGDLNQDDYDDIIYLVIYDSWEIKGYIYYGGSTMDTFPDVVLHGEAGAQGQVCSGDLNGDSIPDIVIGQPSGSGGYGVVQIYFGGAGMDSLPDLRIHGEVNADAFGCAVTCGDVNGDTFDDLIVGAYAYDGFTLDGRVYVYYGGSLLDTIPDVIIKGHNGEAFGKSVGSGGDVNSDGFEDIVVGADENSEAYPGAGKVYVFLGGDPMDTIPDCWLHGEGATHYLGWFNVNVIKNISFYDRALTGTKLWPNGFLMVNEGKIYMLDGGSPMDTLVDVWMVGRGDSSFLGNWTTSVNRINSDGYGEVLSGAIGDPPDPYGFGMGYLWIGADTMDTIPDAWLKGRYYGDQVGRRVASAGDVNGDGFDEVMFSNYVADSNQTVWVCRYTGQHIEEARSQSQEARFEVYPNPFGKDIRLQITDDRYKEIKNIKIFDITGKEVMVYEIKDKASVKLAIDTRGLPCGVYFLQVEADGESVIRKVVKVR